ncbi:MAG: hypothetical protein U0W24_20080 [Bacteroidales bacterium]
MKYFITIYAFLLLFTVNSVAQNYNNGKEDESMLYASTKQVNQFIRRFNGEEDLYGKRLYPKDKKYRDAALRKRYIPDLFDLENHSFDALKPDFIASVNAASKPLYFDFYGDKWFAEVSSKFLYNGKETDVLMYFRLEKENDGYKWSFTGAYASVFEQEFRTSEPTDVKFIHPMSHEIDFMSLDKVFKNNRQIEHYAEKDFEPDYLSLFFHEVKKGTLVYESVTDVKFHVFQIDNWYFEMQYFTRKGDNTGWLISNLIKIPEKDKAQLIKSINHEN